MANERLRSALFGAGMTVPDAAGRIAVDPKTIERWISLNRLPHREHRRATADLLGADEAYLWPQVLSDQRSVSVTRAEVVGLFPNRGAVPSDLWASLTRSSREAVDVLAYSALFLPDTNPDLPAALVAQAQAGLRVRIVLGDPQSEAVRLRGTEESIDDGLAGRVRMHLRYLRPLLGQAGIEVRLHATTLYNSIYRFDQAMLVNTHAYGSPAAQNPVIQLQRIPGGRLFDHYLASFDRVWDLASPYVPQPRVEVA